MIHYTRAEQIKPLYSRENVRSGHRYIGLNVSFAPKSHYGNFLHQSLNNVGAILQKCFVLYIANIANNLCSYQV